MLLVRVVEELLGRMLLELGNSSLSVLHDPEGIVTKVYICDGVVIRKGGGRKVGGSVSSPKTAINIVLGCATEGNFHLINVTTR